MGEAMTEESRGIGRRGLLAGTAAVAAGAAIAVETGATPAAAAGTATVPTFGPVAVTPANQQYAELTHGVNRRYVSNPEAVVLVDDTTQVAPVVQQAVRAGKRFTVRSGGHCLEDFVDNPAVQGVLDLSRLNKVYWDADRKAFAVESGARLLDVYDLLYDVYGVTVPAGICYSVGAGGHVTGGGWGLLCRQFGLVIDYLYAVEVVVVDATGTARTIVATREANDPNRELWWAHAGGGGGNFGVVTRFWFRSPTSDGSDPKTALPKPPSSVLLQALSWNWADLDATKFKRLIQNYGSWFTANSAPGSAGCALASFMVLNHVSNGAIGMVVNVDATVPNASGLLNSYLQAISAGVGVTAGAMTRDMGEFSAMAHLAAPRKLPWLEATRYLSVTNPRLTDPTLRADYKSAYMRTTFPDSHAAALYAQLTRTDFTNPDASITLSSYGGEVNRVAPSATAYPHRESFYKLMWMSLWNDPSADAANIAWNRDSYRAVYAATGGVPVPNNVTDGCYVNYPDIDLNDPNQNQSGVPWSTLYYKGNYARLQQVKKTYDPANVFRHSQSIALP